MIDYIVENCFLFYYSGLAIVSMDCLNIGSITNWVATTFWKPSYIFRPIADLNKALWRMHL